MNNLTIQLDGEALREATVQAMLGVLTPDVKEQMLTNAIAEILKPSTALFDKRKSPIELAFNRAVDSIAQAEACRMIEEDKVLREKIQTLLRITADKVLNADVDKLAERMANAFVESMRRD